MSSNDFIAWHGGEQPVPKGSKVNVICRRDTEDKRTFGLEEAVPADSLRWDHSADPHWADGDVIAYRLVGPVGEPPQEPSDEHRLPRMWWTQQIWAQHIPREFYFEIGKHYLTLEGKIVKIVERSNVPNYECVKGNDGIWRYNRQGYSVEGLGRTTGRTWDHPTNLIPIAIDHSNAHLEQNQVL